MHLTDVFAPRVGGIEVQVESLARAQAAAGEQVVVVTSSSADGDDGSLPFRVFRGSRARDVRALLSELRPDVAHIHLSVFSPFAIGAARRVRLLGVPVVLTVHSMWDMPVRWWYRGVGAVGGWRHGFVVTSVSTAVAAQVERALPRVLNVVVPNGISVEVWRAPARRSTGVHVVSVGRMAVRRRPLLLLKVLRRTRERLGGDVELRATLVGAGPLFSVMALYLRRHRMTDWVRLTGRRDHAGVREVLAGADIYLNVTTREAFGLATLEARTAGLPVIGRSDTGVGDFIAHGEEGLLATTTGGLVDALTLLSRDRRLRDRMSAHNRARMPDECAWPAVLERVRRCYAVARQVPAVGAAA
ncbi:glycosyltransferase family 4 protein [Saccharothrix isguenensis]